MKRILLVEDDRSLGATLEERLRTEGYQVEWVRRKDEAISVLRTDKGYDLLLLDIGLPDGSGLDLARDVCPLSKIPVIFLTAMSSAEYRLEGFEIGAEDFIPKPFHLKELLLRISKVLGRSAEETISSAGVTLDPQSLAVILPDGSRQFPARRDFLLFKLLMERAPQVVSREEILKILWQDETNQTGRTVDNSIMRLRQLLRASDADKIKAVRGIGYQWVGEQGPER